MRPPPGSRAFAVCVVTVACAAAACGTSNGVEGSARGRTATHRGAAADADTPAAGVCVPKTKAAEVAIVLDVDTPTPRCVVVGPDQHLRIENRGDPTTVTLASAAATLGAGESVTLAQTVGEFLAPGVHTLRVARFGDTGPQIWLQP